MLLYVTSVRYVMFLACPINCFIVFVQRPHRILILLYFLIVIYAFPDNKAITISIQVSVSERLSIFSLDGISFQSRITYSALT